MQHHFPAASLKLGQLRRSNGKIHKYCSSDVFCELVTLTTFSTWTIMVGCNESLFIFQQHLCKLGLVSGEAMVEIHKYSVKQ